MPKSKKKDIQKKSRPKELSPLTAQYEDEQETLTPTKKIVEGSNKKKRQTKSEKKASKRARAEEEDDAEERRLTSILFGGGAGLDVDDDEDVVTEEEEEYDSEEKDEVEQDRVPLPSPANTIPEDLFEIDRTGEEDDDEEEDEADEDDQQAEDSSSDDDEEESEEEKEDRSSKSTGVAWVDEDDVDVSVNLMGTNRLRKLRKSKHEKGATELEGSEFEQRLRQRFEHTTSATARTDWATVPEEPIKKDDDDDFEDDENLLGSSTASLLATSHKHSLPPQILNVVRCQDANRSDPNKSVVQAVNFHPASDPDRPLMLTGGMDKTLRFFLVDGEKNQKIHGIHFPKLPIYSASFMGSTGNVVVSGRRPFFYIYDATAGKLDMVPRISGREEKSLEKHVVSPDGRTIAFLANDGYISLVNAHNKHWVADLKMNGSVRAVTFTPDGDYILGSGSDGDVYRWDLRSRKCVERFSNEDGTITSSMSASSRHLAVGSESGVVNLYSDRMVNASWNSSSLQQQNRKTPIKSIMNLATSADLVRYNHDGQILAMSSRREKDSMKLLHVPTSTVFSNWPTSKTPLSYVWSMDFSPESRFLAIGNDNGKCLLYKLLHYHD